MRFCVLGSGSRGNATYVEADGTRFLVDAGFSAVEIERRLAAIGVDPATLDALFVTHEHGDHIKGVSVLSRRYRLPVLATEATLQSGAKGLEPVHDARVIAAGRPHVLKDTVLHPFSVSHDAADPVGFLILTESCSLGYCTDTGTVSRLIRHRLAGCNGLILECNHDPHLLKNGPYPPHLKQRIRSKDGHLANADAMDTLRELLHEKLSHVVLAHISETNNCHRLVQELVRDLLGEEGEQPPFVGRACITLALQDRCGELVTLGKTG